MCGCEGGEVLIHEYQGAITGGLDNGPLAGEPMAGEPVAGEPVAGEVIQNCGLFSSDSRITFSTGPLGTLATQCTECHSTDSFRIFKLSFTQPEMPSAYSEAQVTEGLEAVEPHLILGDGMGSQLSQRMIDGHSAMLEFNQESPEYLSVVEWIDSLVACP